MKTKLSILILFLIVVSQLKSQTLKKTRESLQNRFILKTNVLDLATKNSLNLILESKISKRATLSIGFGRQNFETNSYPLLKAMDYNYVDGYYDGKRVPGYMINILTDDQYITYDESFEDLYKELNNAGYVSTVSNSFFDLSLRKYRQANIVTRGYYKQLSFRTGKVDFDNNTFTYQAKYDSFSFDYIYPTLNTLEYSSPKIQDIRFYHLGFGYGYQEKLWQKLFFDIGYEFRATYTVFNTVSGAVPFANVSGRFNTNFYQITSAYSDINFAFNVHFKLCYPIN
jgi:hypothetical protein